MGIISILGMWEFSKMQAKTNFTTIINILTTICIYVFVSKRFEFITMKLTPYSGIFAVIFLRVIFDLMYFKKQITNIDYLLTIIGWIYIGLFPGFIYLLGNGYNSSKLLLLLLVLIWITDSAAYFIGMRFGKHRGIFPVSPRKSLEGFIAGIIAPVIVSVILMLLFKFWTWYIVLLAAFCAGFFGQIGDLFESKIKRMGGVKDSSNIIPGHGGILDRFDSLLIAGPVLYLLLIIIS